MMGVARGLALILTSGVPIYGLDTGYKFIGQGKLLGVIPVPTVIVAGGLRPAGFVVRTTRASAASSTPSAATPRRRACRASRSRR